MPTGPSSRAIRTTRPSGEVEEGFLRRGHLASGTQTERNLGKQIRAAIDAVGLVESGQAKEEFFAIETAELYVAEQSKILAGGGSGGRYDIHGGVRKHAQGAR